MRTKNAMQLKAQHNNVSSKFAKILEFSHCENCQQFNVNCFPSIVCKDVK